MTISLTSRPALRGRVLVRYPARVDGGTGISAVKANGVVTISLDAGALEAIGSVPEADLSTTYVIVYNSTDGTYSRVALDILSDAIGGGGGAELGDTLTAIDGLTMAADQGIYFTASDAAAAFSLTAAARDLLDDATASDMRTTLGVAIGSQVQAFDADLSALAALSGTNTVYYRSAADTWTAVTFTSPVAFAGGAISVGAASTTASGIVELATDAETVTGTDAVRAASPANITARLAAPGAIGGTTPGAGAFTTLSASGLITATGGQIKFPGTQVPSADVNTLDHYEEGTFTPTLTFDTPGDLSVTYAADRAGSYIKIGRLVIAMFQMTATAFTHTTASGNARVTGLPFTALAGSLRSMSALNWAGITKANYTNIVARVDATTAYAILAASGSGQALGTVAVGDMPSGGTPTLRGTVLYLTDN